MAAPDEAAAAVAAVAAAARLSRLAGAWERWLSRHAACEHARAQAARAATFLRLKQQISAASHWRTATVQARWRRDRGQDSPQAS